MLLKRNKMNISTIMHTTQYHDSAHLFTCLQFGKSNKACFTCICKFPSKSIITNIDVL